MENKQIISAMEKVITTSKELRDKYSIDELREVTKNINLFLLNSVKPMQYFSLGKYQNELRSLSKAIELAKSKDELLKILDLELEIIARFMKVVKRWM